MNPWVLFYAALFPGFQKTEGEGEGNLFICLRMYGGIKKRYRHMGNDAQLLQLNVCIDQYPKKQPVLVLPCECSDL